MTQFQNNSIFWVEVDKIKPNPYQPRREFNEDRLKDLAESIRQYGVLQPLVVTRKEKIKEDGGLRVEYELIAGERRHRASKLASLTQVPVIIRSGEEDAQVKLELAIIENLQREDLNPIERAQAFSRLSEEFEFTHTKIAEKIGRSREYVSNSIRLLGLPDKVQKAVSQGKISEGHGRTIMMLRDKPQEQLTLFKEVMYKQLTVRETEKIARRIAKDKVRKQKNKIDPKTIKLEEELSDTFGTRVKIERKKVGGKLVIDFFSNDDLQSILELVKSGGTEEMEDMLERYIQEKEDEPEEAEEEVTVADALQEITSEKQAEKSSQGSEGTQVGAETLGTLINQKRVELEDQGVSTDVDTEESEVDDAGKDQAEDKVEVQESYKDDSVAESDSPEPVDQSSEQVSVEASANDTDEGETDTVQVDDESDDRSEGPVAVEMDALAPDSDDEDTDNVDEDTSTVVDDDEDEGSESAKSEDDSLYSVSNFSI